VFRKPHPASGIRIYLRIAEQIRHALETGALAAGTQLPSIRSLAETLVTLFALSGDDAFGNSSTPMRVKVSASSHLTLPSMTPRTTYLPS